VDFNDRHVIVTGGTGALGIAVVGAVLDAGGSCRIPFISSEEAARFPFRDHPKVTLVPDGQLDDEGAVARVFSGVPSLWASIHLAGGYAFGKVSKATKADVLKQLEMNFLTCFLSCRAAANMMAGSGGRIVNVSALPGLEWRQGANMAAYTASKAAVAAFTVAFAEEVVSEGILVNAVAPSILDTPTNRKSMPKADYSKWPKVEEVARTILFLASPDNKVTRGAVVPVYGAF
jgi:NAD(P)-dependent dehydrogenase (short-subunit alcohol dehydrogenase family)